MPDVLLLHGWPGSTGDYDPVLPLLDGEVLVPALRGFGAGFDGELPLDEATADAHARRILSLIGDSRPVVVGYDIGSRIAQAIARRAPDAIRGLVITPSYAGIGDRIADPEMQPRLWYQHFHRLPVADLVLDGDERALDAYLTHLWATWSGDETLASSDHMRDIVASYARPGAFRASIAWYRAGRGFADDRPIAVPTRMLWPIGDPLFPVEWADRVDEWFTDSTTEFVESGHFVPLQAPGRVAAAVRELLR